MFFLFCLLLYFHLLTLFLELASHLLTYVLFLCQYRYVISKVHVRLTVLLLPDDAILRLVHGSAHDVVNDYDEEDW